MRNSKRIIKQKIREKMGKKTKNRNMNKMIKYNNWSSRKKP